MAAPDVHPISAEAYLAQGEWPCEVAPGIVFCLQQTSVSELFFLGRVDLPLLEAYDRWVDLAPKMIRGSDTLNELSSADRAAVVDLWRAYALEAVVAPPLSRDGAPGTVPVERVPISQLQAIWGSRPPAAGPALTAEAARPFRHERADADVPDAPGHDGAAVRPAPVVVDLSGPPEHGVGGPAED